MRAAPCVVSVAEHAGWAHLVCVAAAGPVPIVIARRRVTLIDPNVPTMPYEHESVGMKEAEADALIARVRRSIAACTTLALQRVVTELSPTYAAVAVAIRKPSLPGLPATVRAVRQSYRLQCAADGMLYQLAICDAAKQLGLDVEVCRRGDEAAWAAQILGVPTGDVEAFVTGRGRPAGPPWTEEHRRAYAAGIAALEPHARASQISSNNWRAKLYDLTLPQRPQKTQPNLRCARPMVGAVGGRTSRSPA
jgi:hypothetical protein